MAILDTIRLDFQVLDTKDPKSLVVMDNSIWGFIEDKVAIIEIITPGRTEPKVYTFEKGKNNSFNSSNLYLSPIGIFNDLPDGIYTITIKGSPDSYCTTKTVLKTDTLKLELAEAYIRLGTGIDSSTTDTKKKLRQYKLLIDQAEYSITKGEVGKGINYIERATKYIKDYNSCETCK